MQRVSIYSCLKHIVSLSILLSFSGLSIAMPWHPNGVYFGGGYRYGYLKADDMELPSETTYTILQKEASKTGGGFAVNLGYVFLTEPYRIDLEFVHRTELHYNPSPILGNVPRDQAMNSHFLSNTLMLDGYWDMYFWSWHRIIPFIKLGLGIVRNRVAMTAAHINAPILYFTNRTTESDFAWQAGAGIRYNITHNIFVSLNYQYVDLNRAHWGPWEIPSYKITAKKVDTSEALLMVDILLGNQDQPPPSLIGKSSSKQPTLINDDTEDYGL